MLELDEPGDFVVGTGRQDSVSDFVNFCGETLGIDAWRHVEQNESLIRPSEVDSLMADVSTLNRLGWRSATNAKQLAEILIGYELQQLDMQALDLISWEDMLSKTKD
jgi:GDPmannose 4,6-dehydratase